MKNKFVRLFVGGFFATIVMVILMYIFSAILGYKLDLVAIITNHIAPNVPGSNLANSFGFGAGNKINAGSHMIVGSMVARYLAEHTRMAILAFFALGTIILPLIYLLCAKACSQNKLLKQGWKKGLLFGLLLGLIIAFIIVPIVIPMLGYGFLLPHIGNAKAMSIVLISHLGYGATLGSISGNKISSKK